MKMVHKHWLENLHVPEEFHNRIIRDDNGEYWIACQIRSKINIRGYDFYPKHALQVMKHYSMTDNGTIIYEDLG